MTLRSYLSILHKFREISRFYLSISLSAISFRGGLVPSDLGVRNNQTSTPALCLWNDTTLPAARFLGFNTRSKRSIVTPSASGSCCSFNDRVYPWYRGHDRTVPPDGSGEPARAWSPAWDMVVGGSLQWLPARVMSDLPRWHTQRCGRCQNSRYLYGQTRALPLSSTTCLARTSPSTILRHRPPVR